MLCKLGWWRFRFAISNPFAKQFWCCSTWNAGVYDDIDQKALKWTCSNWEKAKPGSKNTITTMAMTSIAYVCIYNWYRYTYYSICHSDQDQRCSTNFDWTRHLKRLRSSPSQDLSHNWPESTVASVIPIQLLVDIEGINWCLGWE